MKHARRRTAVRSFIALAMTCALAAIPAVAAGSPAPHQEQTWADARLAEMTLEEKVGQLFVTYVYGASADTDLPADVAQNQAWLGVDNGREAIEKYHLGGVIYFAWSRNLADPYQVADLSNGLQAAALEQPAGIPLQITTDQEHGIVTRLAEPLTRFPGNMALGAAGSAKQADQAARIAGRELRAVGINTNYAPVADVNVNAANPVIGARSFGADPEAVAERTAAQVTGYQSGKHGVATSVKHFPGHGDTDTDSHTDLPVITHSVEEWNAIDAPPFKAAIEAGAASIMTGHLQFPALDPSGVPATLSEPIMTGLLREELGYDGVVVTDSLAMAGVRMTYPDAEVPVRALQAGVDQLLMPPDLDLAYHSVLDAVAEGELTEQRIDESVRRILTLKENQGITGRPYADRERIDEVVGRAEHLATAQDITDRTTTLISNEDALLPLAANGQRVLVTGWGLGTTAALTERIGAREVTATRHYPGSDPGPQAIEAAVAEAQHHDVIVVTTSNTRALRGQAALVEALTATGKPVVTLAVGTPYDIAYYPGSATHLAAYSYVPVALESAARVLFGEVNPRGRLPVMVPSADDPQQPLFPLGHGLRYRN
jgi:beta-N-acetylhexosaminidase